MAFARPIQGLVLVLITGLWAIPTAHASRSPVVTEQGAKLYQEFCASCHGDSGKGDGPLTNRHNWWQIDAPDHSRKPRDLTRDWFRFGDGKDDIMRTIRHGSGGTAMTDFAPMLSASDVEALADTVLAMRGGMSNEMIQRRFPERIPKTPGTPQYHRMPAPAARP
jgi:mono/diheme cytochrome c family protein